jgi:putative two-component system response regulator
MQGEQTHRVLAVDDNATNLVVLEEMLGDSHFVKTAENGEDALRIADEFLPDLVLLDLMMPGIDGYETCRRLRRKPQLGHTKVFMVSARSEPEDRLLGYEAGIDDYIAKPILEEELLAKIRVAQRLRTGQDVEKVERLLDSSQDIVSFCLAKLADLRDPEDGSHLGRVREYSRLMAQQLAYESPYAAQIDARFIEDLIRASPLHDIGKVGVPDDILFRSDRLSDEEFNVLKRHTTIGAEILEQAVVRAPEQSFLKMAAVIALCHHERYDGKGYPLGLRADDIPLPARIVAVADVYDALTTRSNDQTELTPLSVKTVIESQSGKRFDPVVVDAFRWKFEEFVHVPARIRDELATMDVAGSLKA